MPGIGSDPSVSSSPTALASLPMGILNFSSSISQEASISRVASISRGTVVFDLPDGYSLSCSTKGSEILQLTQEAVKQMEPKDFRDLSNVKIANQHGSIQFLDNIDFSAGIRLSEFVLIEAKVLSPASPYYKFLVQV